MNEYARIIEEATDEDGTVQLLVANKALSDAIEEIGVPVSPGDSFIAFIEAQKETNRYLGSLVLAVAAEVGGLEEDFEDEMGTFIAYLDFTILSALYRQLETRRARESGLTVITGEHPPIEGLT